MSEPYIGEIKVLAFDWAPVGWATCAGQLLSISQNTALFSLVGTTYGGNGQTTFALPDLRGRRAYHQGQGPGLSAMDLGEVNGTEQVTLTTQQIPAHTHPVLAVRGGSLSGPSTNPTNAAWSNEVKGSPQNLPYDGGPPGATMSAAATTAAGNNVPHENRPPYLALNFVISLDGTYPSRP